MKSIGLQHISVTVSDLKTSVSFYGDLLGLELLGIWNMPQGQVRDLFKLAGVSARYAWLQVGKCGILELIEFDPTGNLAYEFAANRPGPGHFAIQVEDLDAVCIELEKLGVKFLSKPRAIRADMKSAFIYDPDGAIVELVDSGLRLIPRIRIFGTVWGMIEKFRRRRARQMAPGACSSED